MRKIDRLTCEETFRRLADYVDRELSDEQMDLVREHLETCAICTGIYQFESGTVLRVREKLQQIQAPQNLMEKISKSLSNIASSLDVS